MRGGGRVGRRGEEVARVLHFGRGSEGAVHQSTVKLEQRNSQADDERVFVHKLPAGEVARAGLVLMGLGIGLYVLWHIHEVVLLLLLGILLATAIEPLVNRLRRGRYSRGTGVLVVYTAIILAIGLPMVVAAPTLVAQGAALTESVPDRLDRIRPYAAELPTRLLETAAVGAIDRVREMVRSPAPPNQEQIVDAGAKTLHLLLGFVSVFFLAYYWLVERPSIKRVLLRLVPTRYARDVNEVWLEVEDKLGGWVRGQLLVMLAMGVMAGVGFFFIGLPNPFLLGVVAGICEVIPMIGPFLAFLPAVLVALGIDPYLALIVIGYAVVIQQIESNILVPRIMGHTVGISPMTVLLGILIGAIMYGLPGAFLAVPVAGAIQVIVAHVLRLEEPAQAEVHTPTVAREAATPSTGATAGRAVASEAG
jgi:predicted PurR-regulated permease PerM